MRTAGHPSAASCCSVSSARLTTSGTGAKGSSARRTSPDDPRVTAQVGGAGTPEAGPLSMTRWSGRGAWQSGPSVPRHLGRHTPHPQEADGLQLASSRTRDGDSVRAFGGAGIRLRRPRSPGNYRGPPSARLTTSGTGAKGSSARRTSPDDPRVTAQVGGAGTPEVPTPATRASRASRNMAWPSPKG
jgi:hypothetical protein